MRTAIIDGDLVVGTAIGQGVVGMPIPPELSGLPTERLRFADGVFVDAATVTFWAIDPAGRKRLTTSAEEAWPRIDCPWDAELIQEAGAWRPADGSDLSRAAGRRAFSAALASAEEQLQRITSLYVPTVRISWSIQAIEANAALGGAELDPFSIVRKRAEMKGRTVTEEATVVKARADAFQGVSLLADGLRDAAEPMLAATTQDEIDAAQELVDAALAVLAAQIDTVLADMSAGG